MRPDLFLAAKKGNLKAVENLHRQTPVGRSEVTFEGNTALHIAAREGHLEVVKWILNNVKGRCISGARNGDKNTPLHEAAKKGDQEIVRILLKYNKYAVYRRNQFGETALIIASQHGHVESARLLLAATPLFLVFWPREDRQTCLNAAAYGGHLGVVKLILSEKPSCFNIIHLILLVGDENGVTPLHAAVHGGHLQIVKEILNTPLNWCCGNCCDKSLMTKKDELGRCAIHIAAMKGFGNIVDEFISLMPDCVEIRSSCNKTPVHFAVEYNHIHIVKRLVSDNDDEVNAKLFTHDFDMRGNTALHLAVMNAVDPELVRYLTSISNANLNAINNEGSSPLDIATTEESQNKSEFGEIVGILECAGATHSLIRHSGSQLSPWKHSKHIPSQGNGEVESKIFDVDTLVASLIATVTFAAIFQVPGGTQEDTGLARMSLQSVFQVFLFSDSLAFFASMTVVIAWIFRERLQTRLIADRSALAKLSMLSLGTSIVSTGLAFLCATILVTVPRNLENYNPESKVLKEYQLIFAGEILTAYVAPALAVVFLSLAWLYEYNFNATNERQARLKWQLKRVLISTLPVAAIVLTITFIYIANYL